MSDIFISHSHHDSQIATGLKKYCEKAKLSVFLDEHSIDPGEDWQCRLHQELKECDAFWLLASKEACESRAVTREIAIAEHNEKEIIIILWNMSPEQLPSELKHIQALVLQNKTQAEINQIFENLIKKAVRRKFGQKIAFWSIICLGIAGLFLSPEPAVEEKD